VFIVVEIHEGIAVINLDSARLRWSTISLAHVVEPEPGRRSLEHDRQTVTTPTFGIP
jgi:hypothetical protein